MVRSRLVARLVGAATLSWLAAAPALAQSNDVNLYTYREPGLIRPALEAFTKATGIKVNTLFAADGLAQRMRSEGVNSPADLLIAVDIGRLQEAIDLGVTQPVKSDALDKAIPAQFRDPQGQWHALTLRSRIAYVAKDRVADTDLTYEGLADPKWRGKICIRSGQHPYNTSLFAAFIAKHGEAKTETWLKGLKANLARKPSGGDREGARDILAGACDLAIGNSYYVGLMRNAKEEDQRKWGNAIRTINPTFEGGGTHVNISGLVMAKHAPNRANAAKLMEFLVSDSAQHIFSDLNYEYPVVAEAPIADTVKSFGALRPDSLSLNDVAKHRKAASTLVDKVGFDR
ncbi:MAG TPA: Fe(3+) ABC transporter substrate-binding protein [Xanthobacteraceae bacterium]|nr:Fe(3+) ABC transporter substrate-binding protein [Xanthobacteraceae bacterium]